MDGWQRATGRPSGDASVGSSSEDGQEGGLSRRAFLGRLGYGTMAAVAGRTLMVGSLGTAPFLAGAAPAAADAGRHLGSSKPSHDGAETLTDWYAALYSGLMDEGTTPPLAARVYAYVGVAAYEAVAAVAPRSISLAGQLNGLRPAPPGHQGGLDLPSVVSASIAACAASLLRAGSASLRAMIDDRSATHLEQRASAGIPPRIVQRSIAHGRRIGEHVASWASDDGAEQTIGKPYTPPVGASLWRSTPPNFGAAIDPHWGSVRPLILPSASFCAPPPPPADFATSPDSAFYLQAEVVLDTHAALTDEQRAIALFWRDNPITSGLPSGHWMLLTGQLCQEQGLALDDAAEVHALAGIALADAFTSCWHEKYVTNLLRPVSYIREHIPGQESWLSFVNTPQFPEYTSGHSVASQAVATVLTARLGVFPFTDRTHQLRNPQLGTRSYSSLQDAADAAAASRLLGGIHYPMGIEQGLDQGAQVGRNVLERVTTRRRRPRP